MEFLISVFKATNPYPWILEKDPNRGTVTERVSREKNPERSAASFVYVSLLWIFSGKRPKNSRMRVNSAFQS